MASRKGIPNKIGAGVKANIIGVFEKIGGRDAMAEWAKENKSEFYRLYARLAPTEVLATVDIRDATELSDGELASIASGSGEGVVETQESGGESGAVH